MHASRIIVLCLFAVGVCLLGAAATQAGVEDYVMNDVSFRLSDTSAFTYHTTNHPNLEVATVRFTVAFDAYHSGYLQGADIWFTYDPNRVTLVNKRPAVGWGSVTPLYQTSLEGGLVKVYYGIDPPPNQSTISMTTTPTVLAEFDFVVECQANPATADLLIIPEATGTRVDDGANWHYVTQAARYHKGTVARWEPIWAAWLGNTFGDLDIPGALGTVIDIPIFVGTDFKLASADMKLAYDVNKLQFVQLADLDSSITGTNVTFPQSGQVRLQFATNEATVPRHEFSSDVIGVGKFRVIGNWQGGCTDITWVQDPILTIAQDAGTCSTPLGTHLTANCNICIPQYTAHLTTEFTDGGKIGLADDQASVMIHMTNNFPAGKAWHSIITNLCLGPTFEKDGTLTYEAINFGASTYDGTNGQELSLWTESNPGTLLASDTAQDMVAFNITPVSGFTPPTNFDSRFYPITYQVPFDSDPNYDAKVKDTTGNATLTHAAGTYTWDSPQVEYLMGEYYCTSASGGQGVLLSQSYYMRSSFDLHDFKVKIQVSGDHSIYNVVPEANVQIFDADTISYKWVVLKAGPGWCNQPAGDTRVKFATITYSYWGAHQHFFLDRPPHGYWVTKSSAVSFVYDAGSGYYMKDPSEVDQHKVAIGGTLTNSWYVDWPNDPKPNLAGPDGMPTDYALLQNYPNPFNPTTDFWYALPEGTNVEISVYNITGQKVATLVEGWREAGFHQATWNAEDMATGVYFYRLQTDRFTQSKKMILMK